MEQEKLAQQLEALLFYRGEPVRLQNLAAMLDVSTDEVSAALNALKTALAGRGIRLVVEGEYAALATAPEVEALIKTIRTEELEGPLGKAGLETLAIIAYNGPISKTDIEYIRGVNSSSILRTLSIRGLVEKTENPKDKRSFLYHPTPELPAALGLTSMSDIPEFEALKANIEKVLNDRPEPGEEAGISAEAP